MKLRDLEKQSMEVPCPGGGRDIKTSIGDLAKRSSVRSSKGEYKFKSSQQSKLRNAMKDIIKLHERFEKELGKAQEEMMECVQDVLANANVLIKR